MNSRGVVLSRRKSESLPPMKVLSRVPGARYGARERQEVNWQIRALIDPPGAAMKTARALANAAWELSSNKDADNDRLLKLSVCLQERCGAPDKLLWARTLFDLAGVEQDKAAVVLYEQTLEALPAALKARKSGARDVDPKWVFHAYGACLGRLGRWGRAREMYERVLAEELAAKPPHIMEIVQVREELAEALTHCGDDAQAALQRQLAADARASCARARAAGAPEPTAGAAMPEEYKLLKARYPGHVALMRASDRFEAYGEDAELLASKLQNLTTLAERIGKFTVQANAVEGYIARLVRMGYAVVMADEEGYTTFKLDCKRLQGRMRR